MTNAASPAPPPASPKILGMGIAEALTVILALSAIMVTYQVSKVGDLANDIRNSNSRIDQIYPVLVEQSKDLGSIKGSMEVSAQKITLAAERITGLSDRLAAAVAAQDAQAKSMLEMAASVSKLALTVQASQQKLDSIDNTLNVIKSGGQLKKIDYFDGALVFTPLNGYKNALESSEFQKSKVLGRVDKGDSQIG